MDTNNHLELEQMRAQLGILKQKLEKQDIVNERLMRKSMKSKMSWINKYLVIVIFAIPFVAFAMLPMVHEMNISWWWYGFTLVMMTGSIIADWYINYMRDDVFLRGNLVETAERLSRMKRLRLFFKMQRTNDEIINDIEELTNKQ